MDKFEFSIIASGINPDSADFDTRFYDAGCDDATVSFQKGHIILDFAREAPSFEDALISAVENARAAGAHVDRVEPDPLVSLSDIASRSALTKAAISNYAKGRRGENFPAPVARVTSESPLWDWSMVAVWLFHRDSLGRGAAFQALVVKGANEAVRQPGSDLPSAVKRAAAEAECVLA